MPARKSSSARTKTPRRPCLSGHVRLLGRDHELDRLHHGLLRLQPGVLLVVGARGSGKSALLEEAVRRLESGWEGVKASGVAVCPRPTEGKLPAVRPSQVLVVDDLHVAVDACGTEIFEELARLAGRGVRVLGAMEEDSFFEEVRPKLKLLPPVRPLLLAPLDEVSTATLLSGAWPAHEKELGAGCGPGALEQVVSLAKWYQLDAVLPGAALTLLDEASALHRLRVLKSGRTVSPFTAAAAAEHLSLHAGITVPARAVSPEEAAGTLARRAEEELGGHGSSYAQIASTIQENRRRATASRKPMGCFIFAGVRPEIETRSVKVLAGHLFGCDAFFHAMNLEGRDRQASHELLDDMVGEVRRLRRAVVLVRNIEAVTQDVVDRLASMLEEGEAVDELGRKVPFTESVFVFQTQVGSAMIQNSGYPRSQLQRVVTQDIHAQMPPAVWRRADRIILFERTGAPPTV